MNAARKIKFLVPILFTVALIGLTFALFQEQTNPSARDHAVAPRRPFLTGPPSESLNRFAWVTSYPGTRLENIRTVQNRDQLDYGYHFQVKDEGAKVRKFYESSLRSAGFTVIGKSGANGESWDLYAENPDRTRSIDVNGNAQPEGVNMGVMAVVR
jgi:hypothetical protein